MTGRSRVELGVLCIVAATMASGGAAGAAESLTPRHIPEVSMAGRAAAAPASQDLETLRRNLREQMRRVDEQARLIEAQRQQLDQQRRQLENQQRQLEAIERLIAAPVGQPLDDVRGGQTGPTAAAARPATAEPREVAQAAPQQQQQQQPQQQQQSGGDSAPAGDGAAREGGSDEAAAPDLAEVLEEVGRVLTRKGTLIVEPQFQYSHNTASRFFFNGVEIFPGFNIGVISITDNKRNTFTNSVGLRYGITNRFEADLKIPFVINQEEEFSQILSGTQGTETRSVSNRGLGDVEFGAHYQINRGRDGWPFFVGNVRVKTPTGEGPFDIDQDKSATTGSGFWGVEPSLTVIYPSDPGVLFANVGYLVNLSSDVESRLGSSFFTNVSPGNVLRTSFGYGIGLNERLSVNFGYKHDWVQGTKLSFRDAADPTSPITTSDTGDFQVGALQFGVSYKVTPSIPVIVNVSAGVTSQAPDAEVGIRVPVPIQLFD